LYFRGQALAKGGSESGDGGLVETSGARVNFYGARMNTSAVRGRTGNWLIDPFDLTVDSSAATTINNNLASTNVTLATTAVGTTGPGTPNASGNGDIFINAPISWSTANTLTLSAYRSIGINSNITASGAGQVVMVTNNGGSGGDYRFGTGASLSFTGAPGGGQTLTINGNAHTLLYNMGATATGLQDLNGKTSGFYALANNLTGGSFASAVAVTFGDSSTHAGTFTGLGHTINSLNMSTGGGNSGFIGTLYGTVRDLEFSNPTSIPALNVPNHGIVAGAMTGGTLKNVVVSGASAFSNPGGNGNTENVGGLVGLMTGGAISNSSSSASVNIVNGRAVGGLVGRVLGGSITGSYATGAVSTGNNNGFNVGGLVGVIDQVGGSSINNSYATGDVFSPRGPAGGLSEASFMVRKRTRTQSIIPTPPVPLAVVLSLPHLAG
jgi:hypothetical protein